MKSGMKTSKKELVETCPSFRRGHLPNEEDVERLRTLTLPHVDSFNYFLEVGLPRGIKDLEPCELDLVDVQKLRDEGTVDWDDVSTVKFWLEDVKVAKATKSSAGRSNKLLPRECRERKIIYSGQIFGKFCYQIVQRRNGVEIEGPPVKMAKTFGYMPIMVLTKACHLEGMGPQELVQVREEVRLGFETSVYVEALRCLIRLYATQNRAMNLEAIF
jgi:DNA-directed RNA polymerase I subunit RPA2